MADDDAWADALEESNSAPEAQDDAWGASDDSAQAASFADLGSSSEAGQGGAQNLDFLLDVPLGVTVELGRTNMIINNMLQLTQGSVVELDKAAGEPVEIFVNNKLLGKGEVIVVNERFGVRITEIISQADRIKNMG
ncbi:flagellar motor switch protein FliN [Thermodesulfobacteriota bacterium]